jgi:hypothetical protein
MSKEIDYESKEIKKWAIFAGLGGGFGGSHFVKTEECTAQEAMDIAFEEAKEQYEGMVGLHGLRSIEDIKEEDDIEDDEEAQEVYNEEMEGWIDYHIEEYDSEKHDE